MWKAGKREGRGNVTWPHGANYEGRFRDDAIDGQGTLALTQPTTCANGDWLIPIDGQCDLPRVHLKVCLPVARAPVVCLTR